MTAEARRALLSGAAALVLGWGLGAPIAAVAADQVPADPSFGGTFFLADGNDGADKSVGAPLGWNDAVIALPQPGDLENRLVAPPGTQSVVTFISPQGSEADPGTWNATAPWQFTAPGQWLPDVTPYRQIAPGPGTPSGTNATGTVSGDYSIGVAYLTDGGLQVADGGLYFVHIHLTGNPQPSKATYTWQPVEATGAPLAAPAAGATAERPAGAAPYGLLSLVARRDGDAVGGRVSVDDDRAGGPGWTLVVGTGAAARIAAEGRPGPSPDVAIGAVAPADGSSTLVVTLVSR